MPRTSQSAPSSPQKRSRVANAKKPTQPARASAKQAKKTTKVSASELLDRYEKINTEMEEIDQQLTAALQQVDALHNKLEQKKIYESILKADEYGK